jgi:hypothetical protein
MGTMVHGYTRITTMRRLVIYRHMTLVYQQRSYADLCRSSRCAF